MIAILSGITSGIWKYVAGAGAAIALLLIVYTRGEKSAKSAQIAADAKAVNTAHTVDNDVAAMDAGKAREELARWSN